MDQNDEHLMGEFYRGDQEAVKMIYLRYKSRILNFCLRILGNRADAEDVTGDVFVKIFARKYTYTPDAKFSTWLYTVARNGCISRIRKRKNLVAMWFSNKGGDGQEAWDIPDEGPDPSGEAGKREAAAYVRRAINKLPVEQREAIVLREYQHLSYAEISAVLSCSLEKVKILIFRAREGLRGELKSFIMEEEAS